jgi:hypothetical protein
MSLVGHLITADEIGDPRYLGINLKVSTYVPMFSTWETKSGQGDSSKGNLAMPSCENGLNVHCLS